MASGTTIARAFVQLIPSAEGFTSGISGALAGTQQAGSAAASGIGASFIAAGKTAAAALASAGIVSFGMKSVKVGKQFEKSMSGVYALMSSANNGAGLTADQMATLEARAREMGSTSVYSASQAADAMGYMALAGWNVDQVYAGIPGVLNLAAAGGMDLASASDIVTDGLTMFGMKAEDTSRFCNVLASASANSNTNVTQLGEAFKGCGAVAGAMGYTIEDTTWALGLMANAGIKGANAGTALKSALNTMGTNKKAQSMLKKLGVSMFDASGKARPLSAVLGDLRAKFANMSAAEQQAVAKTLAGSYGMSAFLAIMNATDESAEELANTLNNTGDSAQSMASIMSDNLEGDMKMCGSAFEEFQIELSKVLIPVIRKVVQFATLLLQKFNSMSPAIKKVISVAGIAAGAFAPLRLSLKLLSPVLKTVATKVLALVNPFTLVGAAVAYVFSKTKLFKKILEKCKTAFDAFITAINNGGDIFDGLKAAVTSVFGDTVWNTAQGIFNALGTAITTVGGALDNIVTSLASFIDAFAETGDLSAAWTALTTSLGEYDWAGLGSAIWEAIKTGVTTAVTAAGNWLVQALGIEGMTFGESVQKVGTDLWNAIVAGVKAAIGTIGSFISGLFTGYTPGDEVSGIGASVGSAIKDGIGTVLDVGGSFLSSAFDAAKTAIEGIDWGAVGGVVKAGFDILGTTFDSAGTFLSGAFSSAKSAIESIDWGTAGSAISGALSGALEGLASIGQGIWDMVSGWFGGDQQSAAEGEAQTAGNAVADAMSASLSETAGNALGKSYGQSIADGISNVDFVTGASTFCTNMKTYMDAQNWTKIGNDLGQKVGDGIKAKKGTVESAAKALADAAKGKLKKSEFKTLGEDCAVAFAEGVKAKKSSLYNAFKAIVDDAISALKKAYGSGGGSSGDSTSSDTAEKSIRSATLYTDSDMVSKGFTQNVTINSPTALTPYEVARQTRNATRSIALRRRWA